VAEHLHRELGGPQQDFRTAGELGQYRITLRRNNLAVQEAQVVDVAMSESAANTPDSFRLVSASTQPFPCIPHDLFESVEPEHLPDFAWGSADCDRYLLEATVCAADARVD
jgi:hypothetical protein